MANWLILISILFPVLCGILLSIVRNSFVRNVIIILSGVILSVNAIALTYYHNQKILDLGSFFGVELNEIITILDVVLLSYILYIGFKFKSWMIGGLAALQLMVSLYFEITNAEELKDSGAIFHIDGLSVVMVLVISIIGSLIAAFAIGYMKNHEHHMQIKKSKQPKFFSIIFVFLGAMNGLVLTDNLLWMFLFWEVTTLSSFLLISHDGTEKSINNAKRALWMNLLGGVGFLAGIILIFERTDHVLISPILNFCSFDPQYKLVVLPGVAFLCFAAFTKSAQLPFQKWLLGAMVAPTPVSALLHSSTMVKAGVYLIVRFSPAFAGTRLGFMVAILGGFTFMAASAIAISQSNAKKVLAYSTIANLGLIIACAGLGTPVAVGAAILLIVFHAVSKALMFLCVGTIEQKIGSRDIEDMEGLRKIMPFTASIAAIGGISMLLPPFGVLVSKWLAIEAAVKMPLVLIFIVLGSALTTVFWTKWIGKLLSSVQKKKTMKEELHISISSTLSILVTLVIIASVGIVPLFNFFVSPQFMNVTGFKIAGHAGLIQVVDGGIVGSFAYLPIFAVITLVILTLPLILKRVNPEKIRQPYFCGENCEVDGTVGFKGEADTDYKADLHNYYMSGIFGEENLNGLSIVIGIFLTAVMLLISF